MRGIPVVLNGHHESELMPHLQRDQVRKLFTYADRRVKVSVRVQDSIINVT